MEVVDGLKECSGSERDAGGIEKADEAVEEAQRFPTTPPNLIPIDTYRVRPGNGEDPDDRRFDLREKCRDVLEVQDEARCVLKAARETMMQMKTMAMDLHDISSHRLGEHLRFTFHGKADLEHGINELAVEIVKLEAMKKRLVIALDTMVIPQSITNDCLAAYKRHSVQGLASRGVEIELTLEDGLIENVHILLTTSLKQTEEQLRRNRMMKASLEMEWSNKMEAYAIDDKARLLNSNSAEIQPHILNAGITESRCTFEEWLEHVRRFIIDASHELQASSHLRDVSEKILSSAAKDLGKQNTVVESALVEHCRDINNTKTILEQHLLKVLSETSMQEDLIGKLGHALQVSCELLDVVKTRLLLRSTRPQSECCADSAQGSLLNELSSLKANQNAIRSVLDHASVSLLKLQDTRTSLEKQLKLCMDSLMVQHDLCLPYRSLYPSETHLSGHEFV